MIILSKSRSDSDFTTRTFGYIVIRVPVTVEILFVIVSSKSRSDSFHDTDVWLVMRSGKKSRDLVCDCLITEWK